MNGQCARVLDVLADRQPHLVSEIHQRAGTMRLNSRVSELRRKLKNDGLTIVCNHVPGKTGGEGYEYQLVPLVSSTESDAASPHAPDSGDLVPGSPPRHPDTCAAFPGPAPSSGAPPLSEPAMVSGEIPERGFPLCLDETAGSDVDVDDLQLELTLIERKLDVPVVVDSENARSTRAILERQRREIRDKLARVA